MSRKIEMRCKFPAVEDYDIVQYSCVLDVSDASSYFGALCQHRVCS